MALIGGKVFRRGDVAGQNVGFFKKVTILSQEVADKLNQMCRGVRANLPALSAPLTGHDVPGNRTLAVVRDVPIYATLIGGGPYYTWQQEVYTGSAWVDGPLSGTSAGGGAGRALEVNDVTGLNGRRVVLRHSKTTNEWLFRSRTAGDEDCHPVICVRVGCDVDNDGADCEGIGMPGGGNIVVKDSLGATVATRSVPYGQVTLCIDMTGNPFGEYTVSLEPTDTTIEGDSVVIDIQECDVYETCLYFRYTEYQVTVCAYGLCAYEVPTGGVGYYDRIPLPGVEVSFDDGVNSGSGTTGEDGCYTWSGQPLAENPGEVTLNVTAAPGSGVNCGWGGGSNSTTFNPACTPAAQLAVYMPLNEDMVCACAASGSPYTHWAWPKELDYSDDYGSCTLTVDAMTCYSDTGQRLTCWTGSYSYSGPIAWYQYNATTRKCECKFGTGSTRVFIAALCGPQYSYAAPQFWVYRSLDLIQCKDSYGNNVCKLWDDSSPRDINCGSGAFTVFASSPDYLSTIQGTPPNINLNGTYGDYGPWGIGGWLEPLCSGVAPLADSFTLTGSCG